MTLTSHPLARRAHVGLLVLVLLVTACASAPQSAVARGAPGSFAPLVKQVLPTVVNIAVTATVSGKELLSQVPPELRDTPLGRELRRKFGDSSTQTTSAGSGFIIDPSGVIVTNRHVIEPADHIRVALSDGTELPARVIGSDELTDVAVIQVTAPHPLPAAPWGDSRAVEVGDWILAAGNPFGLGGSVTAGIVSARGRDLGDGPFDSFLQLDAPINPGNSGGPTFDMAGQVVGMTTAIVSPSGGSVGIGFAIPSEIIRPIVAELRAKGHIDRGWLGVALRDTEDKNHEATGVVIADVEPDSPAQHGGLRSGDVVLAVNNEPVDSSRAVVRAVAAVPPGGSVRVHVRRQARELDIPIIVGRRPENQ
jgi:serine protease Do